MGRVRTRTHDYNAALSITLFAALNYLAEAELLAWRFLKQIGETPKEVDLHLIIDNSARQRTRRASASSPFHLDFIADRLVLLNLVER